MKGFRMFFNADNGAGTGGAEFVEMKNPMNGEVVQVPKYLEAFVGAVAAVSRRSAAQKAVDEITQLKADLDDAKLALIDAGKNKTTDKQIESLKGEHENAIKAVSEQAIKFEQDANAWRGKYEDTRISNDLFSALPTSELHNPAQTMATIRALGKPRLVEKIGIDGNGTGVFETVLEADGTAVPVKDYITKFFSSDENKFHLKNRLSPGGGTSGNSSVTNGAAGKPMTRAEFEKLNPMQKLEAVKGGAAIEDN